MSIRRQYQETLRFLYEQLPMFQRIGPAAFKKDLSNTLALMEALGQPHTRYPSVHIAGTNGKGSTAHMLAAVGTAHGLKTGLYISPHYKDFRERIKIDGRYVSREYVIEFAERYRHLFDEIKPSFFEITVAMAFDYFAREKVDLAVIETGLGGRLDSTNVVTPLLSIITNISYDHQQFLGDTLPLIAGEKAGIIKPGVPVVIGETHPESAPVFRAKAAETASPILFADAHYYLEQAAEDISHVTYDVFRDDLPYIPQLRSDLHGPYQSKNLATVLQSVEMLEQSGFLKKDQDKLRIALGNVRQLSSFMGRWQVIGESPTVLVDSAHNEGGLRPVMERLAALPYRNLHMVFGMVSDKGPEVALSLLPQNARYYFAKADIPRGLDAKALKDNAEKFGLHGRAYSSVRNALKAARRAAGPDDLVFVGGSIFVVAEVI